MNSNKINQKIISFLIIVSILAPAILLFVPQQINAQEEVVPTGIPVKDVAVGFWTKLGQFAGFTTAANTTKTAVDTSILSAKAIKDIAKEALQEVFRAFARRLLAQMTQATVNWINSGFHGSPLFLERPGSFFKDIAKSEIRNLVSIVGYNSTSFPFGKSSARGTIEGYKQTFEQHAQYSLSKVINDPALLNSIRNDFNVGGWDGFMINTQYPQNNYIGFQMLYTDELARRLAGTNQNKAGIVSAGLQQSGGFLSPQSCPSNPNYNNLKNQFQRPTFKCSVPVPKTVLVDDSGNPFENADNYLINDARMQEYEQKCAAERTKWAEKNDCPGGLVNTTPGSVVANQIMSSLTSGQRQGELAAAMGNSLSAIFDALLNKFISSGLNALSGSRSNNINDDDNFEYEGQTLGSPSAGGGTTGGFDWNGPDQEIVLSTFKASVQNAIDKANQEIKFIDNTDANNAGILQTFAKIWPKTQELDMCLPGPNFGWQERVDEEVEKKRADEKTYNELKSTAPAFKEWITNKVKTELPSSNSYLIAVNSIKTTNQQAIDLDNRQSTIAETLIRLQSIKTDLGAITTQPSPGSSAEANMVRLKQRFDAMLVEISSTNTVNGMQNSLDDAKDKLNNLESLTTKCSAERTAKGWENPGGVDSKRNNSETEKEVFCESYTPNPPVNCEAIFRTDITDYKK